MHGSSRRLTLTAALGLALVGQSARAEERATAALDPLGLALTQGAARFVKGDTPGVAFAPWEAKAPDPAKEKDLRGKLQAAGGAGSTLATLEATLVYSKSGKAVYLVRATVLFDGKTAALVGLEGKSPGEGAAPEARALADFSGQAQPFQDGAGALRRAIDAGDKSALGLADAQTIQALALPEGVRARLAAGVERAGKSLANVAQVLGAKSADEVRLRIEGFEAVVADAQGAAKVGLAGTLEPAAAGKLTVALSAVTDLAAAGGQPGTDDRYPKDITPPRGTKYPCALTALPKGLPGIPEAERVYVNHVYAMLLKLIQAKLVALKAYDGKSGHAAALATYLAESRAALEKVKAETPPEALKAFQSDVVAAVELLDKFFKEAADLRKAGKPWDDVWKVAAGHEASNKLRGAWDKMSAHYPAWSNETRESVYHHLCALDLF